MEFRVRVVAVAVSNLRVNILALVLYYNRLETADLLSMSEVMGSLIALSINVDALLVIISLCRESLQKIWGLLDIFLS